MESTNCQYFKMSIILKPEFDSRWKWFKILYRFFIKYYIKIIYIILLCMIGSNLINAQNQEFNNPNLIIQSDDLRPSQHNNSIERDVMNYHSESDYEVYAKYLFLDTTDLLLTKNIILKRQYPKLSTSNGLPFNATYASVRYINDHVYFIYRGAKRKLFFLFDKYTEKPIFSISGKAYLKEPQRFFQTTYIKESKDGVRFNKSKTLFNLDTWISHNLTPIEGNIKDPFLAIGGTMQGGGLKLLECSTDECIVINENRPIKKINLQSEKHGFDSQNVLVKENNGYSLFYRIIPGYRGVAFSKMDRFRSIGNQGRVNYAGEIRKHFYTNGITRLYTEQDFYLSFPTIFDPYTKETTVGFYYSKNGKDFTKVKDGIFFKSNHIRSGNRGNFLAHSFIEKNNLYLFYLTGVNKETQLFKIRKDGFTYFEPIDDSEAFIVTKKLPANKNYFINFESELGLTIEIYDEENNLIKRELVDSGNYVEKQICFADSNRRDLIFFKFFLNSGDKFYSLTIKK